jgi:hypothetical protein
MEDPWEGTPLLPTGTTAADGALFGVAFPHARTIDARVRLHRGIQTRWTIRRDNEIVHCWMCCAVLPTME